MGTNLKPIQIYSTMKKNFSSNNNSKMTINNHPQLYEYMLKNSLRQTPLQIQMQNEIESMEMDMMNGSPDEAQFLQWLLKLINAKKVLEIGVFRGATTLALALGLPDDGKVVGLDRYEKYAEVGKKYWKKSGVSHKIDFIVGDAIDSMKKLIKDGQSETFDMVFIDADKTEYDDYYE